MENAILLDANAYFRLAGCIHPLLKIPFGDKKHTLRVIEDLDKEYEKNSRLQTRFYWVSKPEYSENRKDCFKLSREQTHRIEATREFMRDLKRHRKLGVSTVDINCLAHGFELRIPVVTDDQDMVVLANEYEIETYGCLSLLKKLVNNEFLDMKKAKEAIDYWVWLKDLPKNFHRDLKKYFP
jgi:predicted nucleic acid-binding protein